MKEEFAIPHENLGSFHVAMDRINARAAKLGFDPIKVTIGEPVKRTLYAQSMEDGRLREVPTMVYPVTVEGEQPVLKGWRFLAKLDHMPGTNDAIIKGEAPAQYQSCGPNCDHCQTNRNRSETFILQETATGEYKQVGSTCLTDFFNGDNPHNAAAFLQHLFDCKEKLDDYESLGIGTAPSYRETLEALTVGASTIRQSGNYISSEKAEELGVQSTASTVRLIFLGREKYPIPTPGDKQKAQDCLNWLHSNELKLQKAESNYIHNIVTAASADLVHMKNIGILVSALRAHERSLEQKAERSRGESNYIGQEKERLGPIEVTVAAKVPLFSAYGPKTLYVMYDGNDNKLSWFNTGAEIADIGDKLHVNATIKKHEVYRDVRQTTVSRVVALEDALFEAVEAGKDAKTIAKILKNDLYIDHVNFRSGMTPLMVASRDGNVEIVKLLLDAGASTEVHAKRSAETALMFAAAKYHGKTIDLLIEHGADMDAQDYRSTTPRILLEEARRHNLSLALRGLENKPMPEGLPAAEDLDWVTEPHFKTDHLANVEHWTQYMAAARAAAEAERKYFHVGNQPALFVEKDGKYELVGGHLQVAQAAIDQKTTVPALVGRPAAEPALDLDAKADAEETRPVRKLKM